MVIRTNIWLTLTILSTAYSVSGTFDYQYRLPTNARPIFYSIKIHPDLDRGDFTGQVSIRVKIQSHIESLVLHANNLTFEAIFLNNEVIENIRFIQDYDLIEISRNGNRTIPPGVHIFHFKYNGSLLHEDNVGFFKAKFSEEDRVLSYLAVTDFQPTHARRAFPCFDEPSFKARFQLTLVTPNETFTALSNMRVTKKINASYGVIQQFETTPLMSTYLLAFAVTEYTPLEKIIAVDCERIPINIYSYNNTEENVNNLTVYIKQALSFYTNYTSFGYPLPKIDFIEYDRTHSGATENWGLITAKTGLLQVQNKYYYQNQIVNVIAHEIAHFWFGNLVTNDWWNDIWLQEGFAVFMALKVEDLILNSNATDKFPVQSLEDVYLTDQRKPSSPVVKFLESQSDISELFNDVTYDKGATILRMLELVLGENTFKTVMRKFICKFAFKTANTNDFIDIVEQNSNSISKGFVRSFLESYLFQNRYPLIKITEENQTYVLEQVSCSYKTDKTPTPYEYRWTIPLTYITDLKPEPALIWFDRNMERVTIPKQNETWIKFNYKQIGFYRMNYSESFWEQFMTHFEDLGRLEREHLLAEAVQLYESNIISCEIAFKFIEQLGCKYVPLNILYLLWIHLNNGGLQNDPDAFIIFKDFIQAHLPFSLEHYKEEMDDSPKQTEERVKQCAKWIRVNLQNYTKTENKVDCGEIRRKKHLNLN